MSPWNSAIRLEASLSVIVLLTVHHPFLPVRNLVFQGVGALLTRSVYHRCSLNVSSRLSCICSDVLLCHSVGFAGSTAFTSLPSLPFSGEPIFSVHFVLPPGFCFYSIERSYAILCSIYHGAACLQHSVIRSQHFRPFLCECKYFFTRIYVFGPVYVFKFWKIQVVKLVPWSQINAQLWSVPEAGPFICFSPRLWTIYRRTHELHNWCTSQ